MKHANKIMLLLLLLITCQCSLLNAAIPEKERLALIDLYNSTGGDNWKINTGWMDDPGTECSWYGITCDGDASHVTGIDLSKRDVSGNSGNNLTGEILKSIENLVYLTELDFYANNINKLPPEIGNLINLTSLNLQFNDLTEIPPEIGNLINLTSLYLCNNDFTKIPSEIFNLINLTFLNLASNDLTNVLPEIGNLINLKELYLSGNELKNVHSEIFNLTNLEVLTLGWNNLTNVPPEIGKLSNLIYLLLSWNTKLTNVPPEIGTLANLKYLHIDGTDIVSLPPEIGNLSNLVRLSIEGCNLNGSGLTNLPPEIGNLSNLTILSLKETDLTSLPPEIGNLSNLTDLDLENTPLRSLPPDIGNLLNLNDLDLYESELTSLPSEIGNLTNLKRLNLYDNQLTSLPPEIGNLISLTDLNLNKNKLTSVPPEIGNLTNLKSLGLSRNKLTTLPLEIINLKELNSSNFSFNGLDITASEINHFLDNNQSDWKNTQTSSPKKVTITNMTIDSISLSWSAIEYTKDNGGYEVYYSKSSGSSYTLYEITENKTIEQMNITGLNSNTSYYFIVRSVTFPHSSGNWYLRNKNTVYSKFTNEISAKTLPLPFVTIKQMISTYNNSTNIQFDIVGEYIVSYRYKLNQNNWSEECSLSTPLILNNLDDGPYILSIKGKNKDGIWQETPSTYEWTVDTHVVPPKLSLSSNFDSGTSNNDLITKLKELTLNGKCEVNSTLEFFDNNLPIHYQSINLNDNEFTANFILEHGEHQITAIQTDKAGNISNSSDTLSIKVDTKLENFTINHSDTIDDNSCTWAIGNETIHLSGTKEQDAIVFIECNQANQTNISYPDQYTWQAELTDMPTGQYTIIFHSTDLAGNTAFIEKTIYRFNPLEATIETSNDQMLADGSSTSQLTLSFFKNDHSKLCANKNVQIESTKGSILQESMTTNNNQLFCHYKSGLELGTATINVYFQNKLLGSKDIEMIPGPIDRLVLTTNTVFQEISRPNEFISLQPQDAYGHVLPVEYDMDIIIASTANNNGEFYIRQAYWDWYHEKVICTLPSNTDELLFLYKSHVKGNYTITASEFPDKGIKDASLEISIIDQPIAELEKNPQSYTNAKEFCFRVQGDFVEGYKYKFDQNEWSLEKSVSLPIMLTNVTDSHHTLYLVGKNALNTWQEESSATKIEWTVKTHVKPPENLYLVPESTTDQYIIKGTCEPDAMVLLLCNNQLINTKVFVNQNEFTAYLTLDQEINHITAIQKDLASNISQQSETLIITVDQSQAVVIDNYDINIIPETSAHQIINIGSTIKYHIQIIPKDNFDGFMNISCEGLSNEFSHCFYKNNEKMGTFVSDIQMIPCNLELEITALYPHTKIYSFALQTKNYWDDGNAPTKSFDLSLKVIPRNQSGIHLELEKNNINQGESTYIYGAILPPSENQHITLYIDHEKEALQTKIVTTQAGGTFKDEDILANLPMGSCALKASWIDQDANTRESDIKYVYIDRKKSSISCLRKGSGIAKVNEVITISGNLMPVQYSTGIDFEITSPGGSIYTQTIYTNENGLFSTTDNFCNEKGTWLFQAKWEGNAQTMPCESNYLPLLVGVPGKVIILGGGMAGNENRYWQTTKNLVTNIYNSFKDSGFTDELIYLMINSQQIDINHDDIPDNIEDDASPTKDEFIAIINNGFTDGLDSKTPLYIYMQGHATEDGRFQVFDYHNFISSEELSDALDELQEKTECSVIIIIESCYSGKFISALSNTSYTNRIILTSAGNETYMTEQSGLISFSHFLFESLITGNNLESSYAYAKHCLKKYKSPMPLLYNCGDETNGLLASNIYLPAVQLWDLNPYIENIEINHVIQDERSIPISAIIIQGTKPIQKVWSQIITPDIVISGVNDSIKLREIEYNTDQGVYVGKLDKLYQNGIYTISTYAMDSDFNISEPHVTYINVSNKIQCDLNNDEKIDLHDLIIALQVMCQIETDITFNHMNMKSQIDLENLLWLLKSMGESELSVESEGE